MGLCVVMALGWATLTVRPAQADIAPPWMVPANVGTVGPSPGPATRVQMAAEQVRMDIQIVQSTDQYTTTQVSVTANFQMHNTGAQAEALKVVFPIQDEICFPVEGIDGPYQDYQIDPATFDVLVDHQAVTTSVVTADRLITDTLPEEDCHSVWEAFDASFPANQDVAIDVSYQMHRFREQAVDRFSYILETGSGWYGPIGSADIEVRFPYTVARDLLLDATTPGFHLDGDRARWHWSNFKPSSNVYVATFSPLLWQDYLEGQRRVRTQPREAGNWSWLADAYSELAWATGGQGWGYHGTFEEVGDWRYAQLALQASQQAIVLQPDLVDAWITQGRILSSMALTGNDGKPKLYYPSVQLALHAFDRALAIDKDNVIADDYRHWLVCLAGGPCH